MHNNIDKLNQRLTEALGYIGSEPRFRWMHATELFYFIKDGEKTLEPTGDRVLALVVPTYKRYCWADRIGKVWAIGQWRIPAMSRQAWEQQVFGSEFPYPENGQYYYVDGTDLRDGLPPDQDTTDLAITVIRSQMESKPDEIIYETEREHERERAQRVETMADEVMEMLPSFIGPVVQGHA